MESGADPHASARAVRVLGRIGPGSETISVLIRIATHATEVRAAAVTELGQMGSAAAAVVPTLVELSNTTDRHLRLVVLTALGNIGNCSCEVLASVLKALAETERQGISPSQLNYNAMCILNQLAPRDCELAPHCCWLGGSRGSSLIGFGHITQKQMLPFAMVHHVTDWKRSW